MKKIFTILLILAIVGIGLADKRPHGNETTIPTNTLPPTTTLPPTASPPSPTSSSAPDPFKNMTEGCKAAIVSFVTDKNISKCLPPNDLLVLLSAFESSDPTKKFVALVQFATTVCPLGRCSNDVISKGKESIKNACLAEDIQKDHNSVALTGLLGTTLYSPIIESLCFPVSATDPTFCFADSVSKFISLPAPPFPPVFGPFIDNVAFGNPTAFCSDCNHRISLEVFNYIFDPNHHDAIETLGLLNVTEAELTQLKLGTMIKCGFTFLTSNDTFPGVCPQTNSSSSLGKSSKFIGDKKFKKKNKLKLLKIY